MSSTRTPSSRPATRAAVEALRQEEEEEEEELPQLHGHATPNGYGSVHDHSESGGAPNGVLHEEEEEEEGDKYEDADTPATGATVASRHSVPSDDTMIGVELARTKVSPLLQMSDADLSPLSVLAQVAAGQVAQATVVPDGEGEAGGGGGAMSEDVGEDVDADGDADEDAEGEPDDDMEM